MARRPFDSFTAFIPGDVLATIVNEGEDSFKNDLQQVLEALQADRAEALNEARELQLIASMLMGVEGARLAARSTADPRIDTLAQARAAAIARAVELEPEIDIAATRVPMVKKTEALVHGRVADAIDRGTAGVTVTLADERGNAVPGVPPVTTDDGGYYALVVPPAAAAEIGANTRLQLIMERDGERVVPAIDTPITLEPGAARLSDVMLREDELRKLKLREAVRAPRLVVRARVKRSKSGSKKRARKSA
jgi:hypothetical protein